MKKSHLNWMLVSLVVIIAMVVIPFSVKPKPKTEIPTDLTLYYWYDVNMIYLNRQNTIANEMNLTGFNESLTNPKTLQEYGFAPSGVTPTPYPPRPNNPNNPNKILYSHP
jgi:hypothetical protein